MKREPHLGKTVRFETNNEIEERFHTIFKRIISSPNVKQTLDEKPQARISIHQTLMERGFGHIQ